MEVQNIIVRKYKETDLPQMVRIWNEVVAEGNTFPQTELLEEESARAFFSSQTETAVAQEKNSKELLGLYILHPNNIGRCGHIANASFAVSSQYRGLHIGEKLVRDCLERAKNAGFKILQFNAVVQSNIHARHLYERLGFICLGRIPGGFRAKNGGYETIYLYYIEL